MTAGRTPDETGGRQWLETILRDYRPGSGEWSWDEEFAEITSCHPVDSLAADIQANGMREPVLLGDDGRVWDGHHRLLVARQIGLDLVPVAYGHTRLVPSDD